MRRTPGPRGLDPYRGWRPGWAAVVQSVATVGREGVSPSFPGLYLVGTVSHRPFPRLHLVGMVSHRPFPRLSDEAHRDREDSIPTGDGGPAGPRGVGSGELRRVTLGLARLLLDANITARISNKPPFDFIVYSTKNKRCVF